MLAMQSPYNVQPRGQPTASTQQDPLAMAPAAAVGNYNNGPDLSAFSVGFNRFGSHQTNLIRPHMRLDDNWGRDGQRSFWADATAAVEQTAALDQPAPSLRPTADAATVSTLVQSYQSPSERVAANQQRLPANRMKSGSLDIKAMQDVMAQSRARVQASGRRSRGLEVAELTRSAPNVRRVHTTWMQPRMLDESDRKHVDVFDKHSNGPWVTTQSVPSNEFNLVTRGMGDHSGSMFKTR